MEELSFDLGIFSEPLEVQANRQGYTLGDDQERLDHIRKSISICNLFVATDKEVDNMRKKLMKEIKNHIKKGF